MIKQNQVLINVSRMLDDESIMLFGTAEPNRAFDGVWLQPLNLEVNMPVYVSKDRTRRLLLRNNTLALLIQMGCARVIKHL